ncbi:TetR/AcrR family transcriptional regulator [Lachnospiraceae bacterium MD1]|uniref:TetR/AcrR family transcriptional regulator n=1 Tax=Variimorphobacter saccharofermentans TaxID=2755051 RepID=A0A839K2B0_9FIRM|nr:TetR/AcrR family transcriptional regulator [Variimorphobacter saccharofermentans]MBB2183342.1 TetR/AcrR family transcriptional regulator [Variimorphobacter saccharofermentans]
MSPKILTEQEKQFQKHKLLEKGKELLYSYGIKKTSVEDITKAAGMAKGSFYKHYDSKEALFLEIITQLHEDIFRQAENFLSEQSSEPFIERVRSFIRMCFHSQELISIFKYHGEIEEMMLEMQANSNTGVVYLMDLEHQAYEKLLNMFHIDTQKVNPGVVHNYLHAVYFGMANKNMMKSDCIDDTFEALINGLIIYILGGIS